jgi:hypothetical protein
MSGYGGYVGWLYFWWTFFLLVGCLGLHHAFTLVYFIAGRRQWPRGWLALEIVYGLINPILYLLVLQPVLFRSWTPSWLPWLSWGGLMAFWSARLRLIELPRRWVRRGLMFILVLVVSVSVRDAAALLTGAETVPPKMTEGPGAAPWLTVLLCFPLYVLPLLILWRGLRANETDEAWLDTRPPSRALRRFVVVLGALLVFSTVPRRTRGGIREELMRHRDLIVRISAERRLDARLLAALVEVTQREYQSPFRAALEIAATDAWLFDSKQGMVVGEAVDPSLGLTQVKANTLLTAYALVFLSRPGAPIYLTKDYRSVRFLSAQELARIPQPALQHVPLPTKEPLPDKDEVVAAVKTPEGNLAAAAFILDVYATQWELTDPRWSIRDKPEILATLFQLGFAHSWPKADPKSNGFGTRVAEAMQDPWMTQHFGPPGEKSP